ncbi:AI-2E family transporter [Kaistia terrae]|uniref:AI-2E family transporter n=1 Tax=Kaistia terrae TaxID=537017 RepID=A0ABW0PU24_9HYPH|nr:AI-2E family transporter [Kaistia terrae]MCX5577019.1 AI-2E family transporter [Kaistia terrae]
MNLQRHIGFWLGALLVFVVFLFVFSNVLLPFLVGMAVAYGLDPIADWLERRGLSRLAASLVILIGFILLLVLLVLLIVPLLVNQLAGLVDKVPTYAVQVQALVQAFLETRVGQMLQVDPDQLKNSMGTLMTEAAGWLSTVLKSLWSGGSALVDVAALFVVTPVVAFYMLIDWDKMVARIDSWVPRDNVETVRAIARDIDHAIAGFVRGQGLVCMLLGCIYAFGLMLIGLNFGLLIGIGAGILSFIPYVGTTVGFIVGVSVALVQFWPEWPWIGATVLVFMVGQFIEGNILQPRLVGRSVGLHPVWLMFALFAFGALFGFVGLLVAVPAAAAVAVLMRFAIARYLTSPIYRGQAGGDDQPPALG